MSPKDSEVAYVANLSAVLGVPLADVEAGLLGKPYNDQMPAHYFLDIAQVLRLLPPRPARVLDLGAGPGWTSEFLARCGYAVVGTDIAPDMVELARRRIEPGLDLTFEVADYEEALELGEFDVVLLYDALHHAIDEAAVIRSAYEALRPGGLLVTVEPGTGHSEAPETRDVIEKFGTTEKDMPFEHQEQLMRTAGFPEVRRYIRLNQLVLEDLAAPDGSTHQEHRLQDVLVAMRSGHASLVVAVKTPTEAPAPPKRRSSLLRRAFGR